MPRPRSRSAADPPALFEAPATGRPRRGRHERALEAAIGAARRERVLGPTHGALVSLARALSRALDHAEGTEQPYAVAQIAREYRATLADLLLVPSGAPADPFTALLEGLEHDAAT